MGSGIHKGPFLVCRVLGITGFSACRHVMIICRGVSPELSPQLPAHKLSPCCKLCVKHGHQSLDLALKTVSSKARVNFKRGAGCARCKEIANNSSTFCKPALSLAICSQEHAVPKRTLTHLLLYCSVEKLLPRQICEGCPSSRL